MEMAVRDALIGFMAATAQAQAEATKGREQLAMVQDMLGQSANILATAKAANLSRQTLYRNAHFPRSNSGRSSQAKIGLTVGRSRANES